MNSQFRHQRDRVTSNYNHEMYFHGKQVLGYYSEADYVFSPWGYPRGDHAGNKGPGNQNRRRKGLALRPNTI